MEITTLRRFTWAATAVIFAAVLVNTQLLGASSPADETDPFIKKDGEAPPAPTTGPTCNVLFTIEAYTMSQTDGAELLQGNTADAARYGQVREMVENGKAQFEALLSGSSTIGGQIVVQQTTEIKIPIAFQRYNEKGVNSADATDFKDRGLGFHLTFKSDPFAGKETGTASIVLERTRLKGYSDQHLDKDGVIALAQFGDQAFYGNHVTFPYGRTTFLGTMSSEPKATIDDSEMTIVFGKMDLILFDAGAFPKPKTGNLEQQLSFYSIDQERAGAILRKQQTPGSAFEALQVLLKAAEAKLEHLSVVRTNGLKTSLREVSEMTYPTTYQGPQFVTQDIGLTGDITANFIGTTPFVLTQLDSPAWTRYLGDLHGTSIVVSNAAALYSRQPVFDVRGVTTALNSALGENELVGTFSPAENVGISDPKPTGRIWFEFLKNETVNP